ncbi:unnamed protein product [Pedinophyceae sp. YPF-701]|nr:unnamed protein product [Pedinophyceae sp. YPF-701]
MASTSQILTRIVSDMVPRLVGAVPGSLRAGGPASACSAASSRLTMATNGPACSPALRGPARDTAFSRHGAASTRLVASEAAAEPASAAAKSSGGGHVPTSHPSLDLNRITQRKYDGDDGQGTPLDDTAAPLAPAPTEAEIAALVDFLRDNGPVTVISGAGMSTESNIPDYRSPKGAYSTGFKPMTHQQFLASPENRRRYWARSFIGWQEFAHSEPNDGHFALARLQRQGWVRRIVTQNVDRLHHKAGNDDVLELHGTTHEVVCLGCGHMLPRQDFQKQLETLNPRAAVVAEQLLGQRAQTRKLPPETTRPGVLDEKGRYKVPKVQPRDAVGGASSSAGSGSGGAGDEEAWKSGSGAPQNTGARRPDGDVELGDSSTLYGSFVVPACPSCDSPALKPNVVFFGDNIPRERSDSALRAITGGAVPGTDVVEKRPGGVLVLGSSLMVWSAFRLIKAAAAEGIPVACVTVGETRADAMFDIKVQARIGEVLSRLAMHPELQIGPTVR